MEKIIAQVRLLKQDREVWKQTALLMEDGLDQRDAIIKNLEEKLANVQREMDELAGLLGGILGEEQKEVIDRPLLYLPGILNEIYRDEDLPKVDVQEEWKEEESEEEIEYIPPGLPEVKTPPHTPPTLPRAPLTPPHAPPISPRAPPQHRPIHLYLQGDPSNLRRGPNGQLFDPEKHDPKKTYGKYSQGREVLENVEIFPDEAFITIAGRVGKNRYGYDETSSSTVRILRDEEWTVEKFNTYKYHPGKFSIAQRNLKIALDELHKRKYEVVIGTFNEAMLMGLGTKEVKPKRGMKKEFSAVKIPDEKK